MSDDSHSQIRIAHLEQTVQQLRERVARLEAAEPHMATKAELIESRHEPKFNLGARKRKNSENAYWINSEANFAIALIAVIVFTLVLTPATLMLLAALFAHVV